MGARRARTARRQTNEGSVQDSATDKVPPAAEASVLREVSMSGRSLRILFKSVFLRVVQKILINSCCIRDPPDPPDPQLITSCPIGNGNY